MDIKVSEPMADFFMNQCIGKHNGQMAEIPNNPIIYGICESHSVYGKDDFAKFLHDVADQLTKEQPF